MMIFKNRITIFVKLYTKHYETAKRWNLKKYECRNINVSPIMNISKSQEIYQNMIQMTM